MSSLQRALLFATFAVPVLLWLGVRWLRGDRPRKATDGIERGIRWFFATVLVVSYLGLLFIRGQAEGLHLDESLPMHLCDWASFATLLALVVRRQTAFELAYCWGLAGTLQGLISPAIDLSVGGPRVWCFLGIHSGIPAAVVWMLLGEGRRPSHWSWRRVALWSEIYLVSAIAVNAITGQSNYGFLAHRPPRASPLDYFPDRWGLYVLTINLFALALFAVMLAPWRLARHQMGGPQKQKN